MKKLLGFLLTSLVSFTSLFGCNDSKKEDFPTVPILEDTRDHSAKKEKTITTLNGDSVTYNMNTDKIVSLSSAGDLVSMGIRPLAVDGNAYTTGYNKFFNGVELLKNTQPFDPEEVLSYKPELILVYNTMEKSDIDRLKLIAPVIPIYFDTYDYNLRVSYIGELFGLKENADKLITYAEDTQKAILDEIKKMGIEDKTVTIFTSLQGITIPPDYNGAFAFNHILYDVLKFKKLKIVDDFLNDHSSQAYAAISNEKLKDYEGDLTIYAALDGYEIPEQVSSNVGWKSLKAVKENRVGVINMLLYSFKDILYMEAQYSELLSALKIANK